jgi:hypothetical protein
MWPLMADDMLFKMESRLGRYLSNDCEQYLCIYIGEGMRNFCNVRAYKA